MALVDSEKKARLVASLINKTVEGRVRWREGVNEGEFVADFSSSSISILQHRWDDSYVHSLSVTNHRGDIVDRFHMEEVIHYIISEGRESVLFSEQTREASGEAKLIPDYFYDLVRYNVMKVDDVYDGVLQELAS